MLHIFSNVLEDEINVKVNSEAKFVLWSKSSGSLIKDMMLLVNDDGDIDDHHADGDDDDSDDEDTHPDDVEDHPGDVDDHLDDVDDHPDDVDYHDADEDEDCKVGRWTPFQGCPVPAPAR